MTGNCGFVTLEQLSHLVNGKPDGVTVKGSINFGQAIFCGVNEDGIFRRVISSGKAAVQLVQDSGEVCHTHRHFLLHQSVRNAPGKETLACTHTAPEEQS